MQTFIKINNARLIKISIKKYLPYGKNVINIYYSVSRYRIDMEAFSFVDTKERDEMINYLDAMFL